MKDAIACYPEINKVLDKYRIKCRKYRLGLCKLKNAIGIFYPEEQEKSILEELNDVLKWGGIQHDRRKSK